MATEPQVEIASTRRYFGTDGVRGIVGENLTVELVEQLARAATIWSSSGRVFVGRDTRASGPELEEAFARGVVEAGGVAVLGGVLPTPAVALLALDLGVVITASHNPPQYNGVKFFDHHGRKLSDSTELEIEALMDAKTSGGGVIDRVEVATDSYLEHILERFRRCAGRNQHQRPLRRDRPVATRAHGHRERLRPRRRLRRRRRPDAGGHRRGRAGRR
jgi:phosphomannomutase